MPIPEALVTGDIVVDRHLYGGVKMEATSNKEPGTTETKLLGGAELSFRIMDAAAKAAGIAWDERHEQWKNGNDESKLQGKKEQPWPKDLPKVRSYKTHLGIDDTGLEDSLPGNLRSYGVWTPHLARKDAKRDAPRVWRVQKHFGYGSANDPATHDKSVYSPAKDLPAARHIFRSWH